MPEGRHDQIASLEFTFCSVVTLYVLTNDKSALVYLMACCLTAPSHYLNQCWLTVSEGNFAWNAKDIFSWYEFENY